MQTLLPKNLLITERTIGEVMRVVIALYIPIGRIRAYIFHSASMPIFYSQSGGHSRLNTIIRSNAGRPMLRTTTVLLILLVCRCTAAAAAATSNPFNSHDLVIKYSSGYIISSIINAVREGRHNGMILVVCDFFFLHHLEYSFALA